MKKFVLRLYQVSLLLLMCWGAHAWFTWSWDFRSNVGLLLTGVFFAVVALIYNFAYHNRLRIDIKAIAFLLLSIFASFLCVPSVGIIVRSIVSLVPLWVLISDKNVGDHLRFISIALAVLILPGFVLHLVFLGGFSMPGIPIEYGGGNDSYFFFNYFICIRNTYFTEEGAMFRFNSVFLEPAYLGTMLAFLIYAGKYNLKKWYNVLLLVYLIASFSLAGIIVTVVGFLLSRDSDVKYMNLSVIRKVVVGVILMLIVYIFAVNFHSGDNMINELIFKRLEMSDDKIIAGNNRYTQDTDVEYDRLVSSGNLFFGFPNSASNGNYAGAGYKVFFLHYGLVPALFYLLMYFVLGCFSDNKRYGLVFTLLVTITFLQAAYPMSFSWIIPVILGVCNKT